jgi:beta-lactamase class A
MPGKSRGDFVGAGNHFPRAGLALGLTAALSLGAASATATAATATAATTAATATTAPTATAAAVTARAARQASTGKQADAAGAICWSGPHPKLAARISRGLLTALRGRSSVVGLKVDDTVKQVICEYHQDLRYYSASVVKVTILAALLRKLMQEHRQLTSAQRALATEMITESDNSAASALWAEVGRRNLQHFLSLAMLKQTVLGPGGYWGLTLITAHDETTLLKLLTSKNRVLDYASRAYELSLMARVIPAQRWGVPAGAPADVTVHVKNGWLPYPGDDWHINSVGSFSGRHRNYMIAVLTADNPSMTYGVDTVQDIAEVINRDLNEGVTAVIPASAPFPSWGTADELIPAPQAGDKTGAAPR